MSQTDDSLNPYCELLKRHATQRLAALEAFVTKFVASGLLTSLETSQLLESLARLAAAASTTSATTHAIPASTMLAAVEPVPMESAAQAPSDAPSILFDWGRWPQIGAEARTTCQIYCPGRRGKPLVQVEIDSQLDCDDSHGRGFFPQFGKLGPEKV